MISEGTKASSLAIIEKKNQRVDGCKGIFFQLFDWKERLARKKLFSKKLLPRVHSKESSKKFGGDDKQPKLHLIAGENNGRISNVNKVIDPDKKHETRAPCLIAKLMGLETMPPAMQKCKSRKGFNGNGSGRTEKFVNQCKKLEGKELILERVDAKNEWWPQKFQKTDLPERRSVAKLGADQLQMKTVLSRSRNHQPPKLCSPSKSSKSSGKNGSRLIDVATRILEPGLQKSRGRYALTYSSNSSCRSNYEPKELLNSSDYYTSTAAMIPKGRTPYKEIQVKWQMNRQQNTRMQNQVFQTKDRKPARSKLTSVQGTRVSGVIRETKSFAPLGQSFNGHTRESEPRKMNDWKYESERNSGTRRKDATSSVQKKKYESLGPSSIGLRKPVSMSGDALSTLLEQKLWELTSQGDDDSAKRGNAPKKTTAMILQKLITALTTEQHYHNHSVGQSNREQDPCYNQHCLSSADTSFRFKAQNACLTTSVGHEKDDCQRLSPGSVLEASFSIESCSSSNQESTISQRQRINGEVENRLLNNVTDILCSISVTETSLVGSKLSHAKGVILDAELMLANEGFPIIQYLFTELETLASIIRMSFSYTRAWNQVKGFAFDSVIEYLDSRFSHYSKCGFSAWSRLPLDMDSEMVILEIIEEIRRWTQSAGMMPDDLVEWDMSHSLGKWTDFEVEAFETGVELDQYILETLVDELVIDLCKC